MIKDEENRMGGRYIISGAQLGELIALIRLDPEKANKLLNEIVEKQHLWESKKVLEEDRILIRGWCLDAVKEGKYYPDLPRA